MVRQPQEKVKNAENLMRMYMELAGERILRQFHCFVYLQLFA